MRNKDLVNSIRDKYLAVSGDLHERGRRHWAAAEARFLGWGGVTVVSQATGLSDRTIRTGIKEINEAKLPDLGRQRRPGAGRRAREIEQPDLQQSLINLIDSTTRGDPSSALKWTCKSTRTLSSELKNQGFDISRTKIQKMLQHLGYSLQSNRKTVEGKQHPDRNAQFEFISRRVKAFRKQAQPVISVDTKKKENLGKLKNPGKKYCPRGKPDLVNVHDFPDQKLGKAVPYGVYDILNNEAGVSVGVSHDTAEFAVAAIARWWKKLGKKRFPQAHKLLVTADSGGSNNPRTRLWLTQLQRFANSSGLTIELCHYPPGTSKWNKIEHRLFCHITRNWQGIPLEDLTVVVNLIGSTRTTTGLEVHAWLDYKNYPKAKKVDENELQLVNIRRDKFHGEWNYTILPSI